MRIAYYTLIVVSIIVTIGIYLFYSYTPTKNENNLITINDQVILTIPEFEQYLAVAQEKWPEKFNKTLTGQIYYELWKNKAIELWIKKNAIDQLPDYKEQMSKALAWQHEHPDEFPRSKKEEINAILDCMIFIECWLRNINNHYFFNHFPIFKQSMPNAHPGSLAFDRFAYFEPNMIVELYKEFNTIENKQYLEQNHITSIAQLHNEIKQKLAAT